MMHMIHWGCPSHAVYLLLMIPLVALVLYHWWHTTKIISLLAKTVGGTTFLLHVSYFRIIVRSIVWLMALLFLFITLMHPQWNKKEETVKQQGRDLFIVLDISRSMLAQDLSPSRLEFAKAKIKRLLKSLSCERVGLIVFAGSTFVQCPLTRDYGAFYMFLDQLDAATISAGTTSLDKAIAKAIQAFKVHSPKSKIVAIFTDGEDFSTNLKEIKKEAVKENLTIFTFGVGTGHGAPIPLYDAQGKQSGHQKDSAGQVVISRLNEDILQNLATDLGGAYIAISQDDSDIAKLVKKLDAIEKEDIEDKKISEYQEQYPWFLLVACLLLMIEWIL